MPDTVTLDFTGLYFETEVDLEAIGENPSVKAITKAALGKSGTTGGKLIHVEFSQRGFLSSAYVEHRSNPVTRQVDEAGMPSPRSALPTGIYGYNDVAPANRVEGVQVSFALNWQYYIFRNRELVNGQSAGSNVRTIVPASNSASETELQSGDIVRWRLVAIGGLPELLETEMASLTDSQKSRVMAEVVTNQMALREALRLAREIAE